MSDEQNTPPAETPVAGSAPAVDVPAVDSDTGPRQPLHSVTAIGDETVSRSLALEVKSLREAVGHAAAAQEAMIRAAGAALETAAGDRAAPAVTRAQLLLAASVSMQKTHAEGLAQLLAAAAAEVKSTAERVDARNRPAGELHRCVRCGHGFQGPASTVPEACPTCGGAVIPE